MGHTQNMRILNFGIYGYGLASLKRMVSRGFNVIAVVTKPSTESDVQPVAEWALSNGLLVLQPSSPKNEEFAEQVRQLGPDLIVVSGYHRVIPKSILDIPSWGTINLHGSLLPKYRGPNPHKWVIIKGEAFTGVTVHIMTPRLDDGDILAQKRIPIEDNDTGGSLFEKISLSGAELLVDTIEKIQTGTVERRPQDESAASYYSYPTERETLINWADNARSIYNLVRGLHPRPGAWTRIDEHKLRVWRVNLSGDPSKGPPGRIVDYTKSQLKVATSTYDLIVKEMTSDGEMAVDLGYLTKQLGITRGKRLQ